MQRVENSTAPSAFRQPLASLGYQPVHDQRWCDLRGDLVARQTGRRPLSGKRCSALSRDNRATCALLPPSAGHGERWRVLRVDGITDIMPVRFVR